MHYTNEIIEKHARCMQRHCDSTNTVNGWTKVLPKIFMRKCAMAMQRERKREEERHRERESGLKMLIEYRSYVTIIQTSIMLSKVYPIDSSFLIATHTNTHKRNEQKHMRQQFLVCRGKQTCDQLKGKNVFNSISEIDANHAILVRNCWYISWIKQYTICALWEFQLFWLNVNREFTTMAGAPFDSIRLQFRIQVS